VCSHSPSGATVCLTYEELIRVGGYTPELCCSQLQLLLHGCEGVLPVHNLSVSVLQLLQQIHISAIDLLPETTHKHKHFTAELILAVEINVTRNDHGLNILMGLKQGNKSMLSSRCFSLLSSL